MELSQKPEARSLKPFLLLYLPDAAGGVILWGKEWVPAPQNKVLDQGGFFPPNLGPVSEFKGWGRSGFDGDS